MALWKREADRDLIELAAAVPDALAVVDAAGNLTGWDESEPHRYLVASDLPAPCDADCKARGHHIID